MATSASDMLDNISDNANKPLSAAVDGVSASQHPLAEQLEAQRAVAAQKAADGTKRGLVFQRFKPGSAIQ